MAGSDSDQERTEQPTSKRVEEARKQGQVPRSAELNAATVMLLAGGGLHFMGAHLGTQLHDLMRSGLSLSREETLDESRALGIFANEVLHALIACAPILGLTLVAAFVAPIAIGGWNLSFEALAPNFDKLNPVSGLERIFSPRSIVELAKAFAKFLFIGSVAAWLLWSHTGELMGLGSEPIDSAMSHAATLTGHSFLVLAGTMGLIAGIDVPLQLWQHNQKLKMSRQEIKEEAKEADGSPEMKGRIRRVQQELARRRMMQEVPKANVIVTNPTHFAVALRYDEKRMRAPIVVAKGADEIAARIRAVATEHNVPIFEAPPLARALHRNVDLGGEIPSNLYVAVAQVLTYIYQVKAARNYGAVMPQPPAIDPGLDPDLTRH
ncbi:MAG TPA: flagellar biosynthesis protein FlhB [Steroidobacteraceae bacterium]|jgi:flagellar biosynthetic protein FlhB|nr:flagellar biosynthesis protein FlhB [Steroidobacteraceae bacterium]